MDDRRTAQVFIGTLLPRRVNLESLAEKLTELVEGFERKTGHTLMTTDDVKKKMYESESPAQDI